MYRPRVQGIVDGQKLEIRNGDPVLHNVHTYEGARTLFNVAQVPGTPNIEKTFTQNGVMLKFKCDVHQWMTGYVWVQNNPLLRRQRQGRQVRDQGRPGRHVGRSRRGTSASAPRRARSPSSRASRPKSSSSSPAPRPPPSNKVRRGRGRSRMSLRRFRRRHRCRSPSSLLLMGGLVHNTRSSLACPDWPLCFGQVFPKMEGGVLVEHSHRLVAATVTLLAFALMIGCWFGARARARDAGWRRRRRARVRAGARAGAARRHDRASSACRRSVSTAHLAVSQLFFLHAHLHRLPRRRRDARARCRRKVQRMTLVGARASSTRR